MSSQAKSQVHTRNMHHCKERIHPSCIHPPNTSYLDLLMLFKANYALMIHSYFRAVTTLLLFSTPETPSTDYITLDSNLIYLSTCVNLGQIY